MAFSLEAALVVPLVISTWMGYLVVVQPAYEQVRQAAHLEVLATEFNLQGQHLYQTACLQSGLSFTTSIQTSPQSLLEICSLFHDNCHLLIRSIPDTDAKTTETGAKSQ